MTRFRFRLESVLRYRQQQVRQAELALLKCQSEVARLAEIEQQLLDSLQEISAALVSAASNGAGSSSQVFAQQHYGLAIDHQLAHNRGLRETAEQELRAAQQTYRLARTEVEKMMTLKDQQQRAFRQRQARHENHQLGEISMRNWEPANQGPLAANGAGEPTDATSGEPGER